MPSRTSRSPGRGTDTRRGLALLAASLGLHAAILVPMALRLFETERPAPPLGDTPIYIDIEPRPSLQGERARIPMAATSASVAVETRPLTGPTVILRAPVRPEEDDDADLPSPPAPRIVVGPSGPVAAGTPEPPADIGAWQVVPGGVRDGIARSMRLGAGGCRIMDGRLDPTEQRICDEAFNEAAGRAGPPGRRSLNPGEARRQAQFARDGARALAQYEARRAALSGGVGVVGPADCPGSNLGIGCAGSHLDPSLRPDSTQNIRTRRDGDRAAGTPLTPGAPSPRDR